MTEPPKSKTRDNSDEPFDEKGQPMNKHAAHTKQFLALAEKSPAMALVLGLARSPLFLSTVAGIVLALTGVPQKNAEKLITGIATMRAAK